MLRQVSCSKSLQGGGRGMFLAPHRPSACRRRACRLTRPASEEGPSLASCTELVTEMLASASGRADGIRSLESFMDYVPDSLLDRAIESKKAAGKDGDSISFADILELMRTGDVQVSDLLFDSFAMRMLVLQQPSAPPRLLSSLLAAPDRSLHRLLVQTGGEECVLTVSMQLQDGLINQYRSSPRIARHWRLKFISGEVDSSEGLPKLPSPSLGPETVVQAQLEALRLGDIPGVYSFASPLNKASTGPLANFSRLFDNVMYKPLLGHISSESLRRIQLTKDTYAEVVGVLSGNTGVGRTIRILYIWSVGKVPEHMGQEEAGCWMVNSVQLVSASSPT